MSGEHSYTATSWKCFACEAREVEQAKIAEAGPRASMRGVQIAVERDDD